MTTPDGRVYGTPDLSTAPAAPTPDPPGRAPDRPPPPGRSDVDLDGPPTPPGPAGVDPGTENTSVTLSDGSQLTVAVDTAAISAVQNQLRSILIAVFLVAAVLVALAVVVIVRSTLQPLDRMTELAKRIARGNRGERLHPDRAGTELGRVASAFDSMLDSVEAAETQERRSAERTRRFFDDAAHELRTPIAGVQAAAQTLIRTGPGVSPQTRENLEILLVRESRRAARLVDDLLSVARIDEGIELQRGRVDVRTLVESDVERLRLAAPERRIDTTVHGHPVTDGDPQRLAQVLANITNNAHAYSPPGEPISIAVFTDGGDLVVAVRDHGTGVPVEERERIFERLVRLDDARSVGGSGLGLSIARDLARAHGGDLTCHGTESNEGSVFELRLPLDQTTPTNS